VNCRDVVASPPIRSVRWQARLVDLMLGGDLMALTTISVSARARNFAVATLSYLIGKEAGGSVTCR
jgi:hypothetical protein